MLIVDGDNYEEKNVERQVFSKLGNKAQVLRDDLQPTLLKTYVIADPSWVVSEENKGDIDPEDEEGGIGKITANELLQENDYVFAVVDNFAARKLLLDAAKDYNDIDIFLGGNDENLGGSITHYCRRNGEDVTMHPGLLHPEFVNPGDRNPGELSCAERAKLDGGTQFLAANLAVTSQLVAKASQFMFGTDEQKAKSLQFSEIFFEMADALCSEYDRRTEYGKATFPTAKEKTLINS